MSARIHLITGRTGVGKTARSITLAEAMGAPVVVIDRIQCYPELAVGSGRPSDDELRGTRRIYLTQRRVAEGDLEPAAAHALLVAWVELLVLETDTIILEGGSMSLLEAMMESPFWTRYRRTHEHLRCVDPASYAARVGARVAGMVSARPGERSMLSELAALSSAPESWAFVQTVSGYDAIFAWCRKNGLALSALCGPLESQQLAQLTRRITEAHLAYAEKQDPVFQRVGARWEGRPHRGFREPRRRSLMSSIDRPTFMLGVFCGARSGENPAYLEGARLLGKSLARSGFGLVYGGAITGMMGALASACLDEGGYVEGVMPEALRTYEIAHPRLSSMIWTESLSERKALLIERSDAFAVLPGGIGTCDELLEVATGAQLGLHSKPTFVLNVEGYYDPILRFVRRAIQDGFADAADAEILRACSSASELLEGVAVFAKDGASKADAARRRIEVAVRREMQERSPSQISKTDP